MKQIEQQDKRIKELNNTGTSMLEKANDIMLQKKKEFDEEERRKREKEKKRMEEEEKKKLAREQEWLKLVDENRRKQEEQMKQQAYGGKRAGKYVGKRPVSINPSCVQDSVSLTILSSDDEETGGGNEVDEALDFLFCNHGVDVTTTVSKPNNTGTTTVSKTNNTEINYSFFKQ